MTHKLSEDEVYEHLRDKDLHEFDQTIIDLVAQPRLDDALGNDQAARTEANTLVEYQGLLKSVKEIQSDLTPVLEELQLAKAKNELVQEREDARGMWLHYFTIACTKIYKFYTSRSSSGQISSSDKLTSFARLVAS